MIEFLVPAQGASSDDGGNTLNRLAAAAFLRQQALWLHRGLQNACDHAAVGEVLTAHDTFHRVWIELIAAVNQACGEDAARTLSALYAFHGHIAGTLERGPDPRLDSGTCAEVRALLDGHLVHLTEAALSLIDEPVEAQHADR